MPVGTKFVFQDTLTKIEIDFDVSLKIPQLSSKNVHPSSYWKSN